MKTEKILWPRRRFLGTVTAGIISAGFLPHAVAGDKMRAEGNFSPEIFSLLRDWMDALIRLQFDDPARPEEYGAFRCPACGIIHGRGGDAVLPLLTMADQTGESRYLDAALRAVAWTKNVSQSDGSWTNDLDPKSWKGTTAFAAIALAEALEWHGKILNESTRAAWRDRLKQAGDFISANFKPGYGNINYPMTGAYALTLLGKMLDEKSFAQRGRELAQQTLAYFTPQNHFLFGEGHPAEQRSPKGCYPIDLGYNVEESLPNLVNYALLADDHDALELAVISLKTHLKFMLPDGAWDNSWGTRSFKWTYWGSRTSDGCQAAFMRLAKHDPVFLSAAMRNVGQFRDCTHDGLLYGGPHYFSHGVKPCVHHTFTHAKALAGALHYGSELEKNSPLPPLPRASSQGVETFSEIDVTLAALGPWRATFSGYDWFYKRGLFATTGGAPGILWHEKLGAVLSGSLDQYVRVEQTNMQLAPDDEDFPLTVRVEQRTAEGGWFTNLHDGAAKIQNTSADGKLSFLVATRLLSADQKNPANGPCRFEIIYAMEPGKFSIVARALDETAGEWSLVIPVITKSNETAKPAASNRWEINRAGGRLMIMSDAAIDRIPSKRERIFNLVPGFEAVPLRVAGAGAKPVECTLQFTS